MIKIKEIEGIKIEMHFDYKGGTRKVIESMPNISKDDHYAIQYIGIWKIMFDCVNNMNAKTILEFGTRDGYSTRMFSKILDVTDGNVYTVDINPPKNDLSEFKNVHVITKDIKDFSWTIPVDILYIDDWHNGYWLYHELERFSHLAKIVMIHDIMSDELYKGMKEWCVQNMMIYTIYNLNGCGLAIIEIEKSRNFYQEGT